MILEKEHAVHDTDNAATGMAGMTGNAPRPTIRPFDVQSTEKAAVKPIPDNYPRVVPYLCVRAADTAIRFYRTVFDATERMRMPEPDGRIGHAELEIGTAVIMLSDEFPDVGVKAPQTIGGTPVTLTLYVTDVDTVYKRAIDAGATTVRPIKDQFYGDRTATIEDPFGHRWNISTRIENLSAQDVAQRAAALPNG
jgi:PhnB protein